MARGRRADGVGFDFGMFVKGGPVTWEILSLCAKNGVTVRRMQIRRQRGSRHQVGLGGDVAPPQGAVPYETHRSRPKARGTGVEADGEEEVGGPNMSDEGRGRLATTRRSKEGPC